MLTHHAFLRFLTRNLLSHQTSQLFPDPGVILDDVREFLDMLVHAWLIGKITWIIEHRFFDLHSNLVTIDLLQNFFQSSDFM